MNSYKQIYTEWKNYGWTNGVTNCREEQECEIVSSLFTKPVEPLFKPVYTYSIKIHWNIKKLRFLIFFSKDLKNNFKDRILSTKTQGYKRLKLFSI